MISPRDVEMFKLLSRYRYLPSNFLFAFVGGNPIRFKQRLGELFHEGYLRRPQQQWQAMNARYRPAIYELDAPARETLADLEILGCHRKPTGGAFAHELLVSLVVASLEIGTRSVESFRFVTSEELSLGFPSKTKLSPSPFAIPVTVPHENRQYRFDLKPDGRPFAIEHSVASGTTRRLFFPGIEVDRHTEPLSAFDFERSSILRKVLAYREMVALGLYKSQFGFTNMLVPIVTVNAQHMRNMMQLVLSLTKGKGASYLLFKTIPDFASLEKTIEPNAALLAEPWLRAGHPPFHFLEELRGPRKAS